MQIIHISLMGPVVCEISSGQKSTQTHRHTDTRDQTLEINNSLSESTTIQLRPDIIHTTIQKGERAAIPFPEYTGNTTYAKTNIENTYFLGVKTHFRCKSVA